jgi:hypothetical protein
MRSQLLSEPLRRLFRLPDIDHPKAVRALSSCMNQQTLDWPV